LIDIIVFDSSWFCRDHSFQIKNDQYEKYACSKNIQYNFKFWFPALKQNDGKDTMSQSMPIGMLEQQIIYFKSDTNVLKLTSGYIIDLSSIT